MTDNKPYPDLHQIIRDVGGIVHGDGNIFFKSAAQFIDAASRAQADEWSAYLENGETPFEKFLSVRNDADALEILYVKEKEEVERLRTQAAQAAPEAVQAFLREFIEHASEVCDHTPESFRRGVMRLAQRAHKMLAAAPSAPAPEAALQELVNISQELGLYEDMASAPAAPAAPAVAGPSEHYDEVRATLNGVHTLCENISGMERRVGPLGSHARGYTHKITAALRHLDALAAPTTQAAPAAVPEGWVPCMIDYEGGYPEEVAFGPQIMMDRLKKWLTSYFAMIAAHPAEGVTDQGDAQKERNDAFEAVRKQLCKLPKYSFALDSRGNIRRWNDRSGSWIEFSAAHELFDPVAIAQAKESGS